MADVIKGRDRAVFFDELLTEELALGFDGIATHLINVSKDVPKGTADMLSFVFMASGRIFKYPPR